MPFVDDQQCVAKQLNRTGQLNSTFEVSEGVDLKASFSDAFHVNKSVPLYLLFVLALCCIKDSSFFNRFSAFGTLTVFLIFFGMFQTFFQLRWDLQLMPRTQASILEPNPVAKFQTSNKLPFIKLENGESVPMLISRMNYHHIT